MPVRPTFDPDNLQSVTTAAVQRLHPFSRTVVKGIIVDSLNHPRVQAWIRLPVFVVMPNPVHLIVRFVGGRTLSDTLRDSEKHTARHIIRQRQAENDDHVLRPRLPAGL